MFGLSFTHILVLLVMALIFIGPEQLPEVARTIGRFLNELKRTTSVMAEDMKQAARDQNIQKSSNSIDEHNRDVLAKHESSDHPAGQPKKDSDDSKNS